ncbi:hypothetical protein M3Y98_00936100 [Aphelenchoides besseyi]|nr:hypothetical protein M3Y98_00936100 [Aphelenchoides besseyi]KAI6194288.1 hypothetical protein M3Y96_01109100 [Aphelenchoides besseyi]
MNAIQKVANCYKSPITWAFARDALEHFTSLVCWIRFNYESYFGDCERHIISAGLKELVFEETEAFGNTKTNGNIPQVGILKKGYLLVD